MPASYPYRPSPRFPELGSRFFDPVEPARFPKHVVRYRNDRWAARVGLGDLSEGQWVDHFGRFEPLPGNLTEPLALRYHGHQFRSYNPELGDGRGFLFAQLLDGVDDRLLDLGTKGSGPTPWSRAGDGRLTLKGGVREVLATELLEALGVYTSKTFSLIETGEALERGDEPSPTRSSVMVRLSHSHVRFGSFQRHRHLRDDDAVRALVEYSIAELEGARGQAAASDATGDAAIDAGFDVATLEGDARIAGWLRLVCERTACLAADWHVAGFVHGVLNTDNMNVTGESFDYGPYRFLPTFDGDFVAAYFDHSGLYAFGRQPATLAWNLTRLAECLLGICERDALVDALKVFESKFHEALARRTAERLHVLPAGDGNAAELTESTFAFLAESQCGFERLFFDWYGGALSEQRALGGAGAERYRGEAFERFRAALQACSPRTPDALSHPYFAREEPCTLLIEEIESIWSAIADTSAGHGDTGDGDWSPFYAKLERIAEMRDALGSC